MIDSGDPALVVLIHAPFGRDAMLIQKILSEGQVAAEVCPDLAATEAGIGRGVGAVILSDEALTPASVKRLAASLGQEMPWSDFPVIVLTTGGEHTEESQRRLMLLEPFGNLTLLERPLRKATLLSAARVALRGRSRQYQVRDYLRQREQDAQALAESEERYRTLAESLPQLVWTCDSAGECDYLSSQWAEYTGANDSAHLGVGWLDAIDPDDRDRTGRAWRTAVATGQDYDIEFRIRRHDGVYRWFKTRGIPFRANGRIMRWLGTCTDIDDRKRTEEERKLLLARERSARGTAELLNQVGPVLVRELDPRKLTQKVTDLATRLIGAQFGALFHNVVDEKGESYMLYTLSGAPEEAFSKFPMPRNTAVFSPTFHNEGIVRSDDITKDPRYGKNAPYFGMPKGHLPVCSYLAAPVVSRSGEILGGLFFGHALPGMFTELEEAIVSGIAAQAAIALDNAHLFEESRRSREIAERSNQDLRRANAELEQFAYSASHDLQEPIRMVKAYTQVLQQDFGDRLNAAELQYMGYVIEGATRMERLVKDLLLYTRSTDVKETVNEPVEAAAVLQLVLSNLRSVLESTDGSVEAGDLPAVPMHEVHLQQLFQNLISNALKYRSAAAPRIRVEAERSGDSWIFSVADNGIGIDQQYADYIFGIFKRLHSTNQFTGTGIGLAICKKIVDRYGGRIWVESEPGSGSTFRFSIPDREVRAGQ